MINENDCPSRREEIVALVLGELESQASNELRRHLESCKSCRSFHQKLMDEEETIRSAFQTISDKGNDVKSRLIEQLDEDSKVTSQADKDPAKTIRIHWVSIIKNPFTKIAAAAAIIIAVMLLLHNGPVTITTPAFGLSDVIKAMNNAQWMHSKYVNFNSAVEVNKTYNENELAGSWFAVNPYRQINISTDNIIYDELSSGKQIVYYPRSNTITISYKGLKSKVEYPGISEMIIKDISNYEKRGAKVTYNNGRLDGRSVKIINIDTSDANNMIDSNFTMYVDPKTRLPIKVENNRINGQKVKSGVCLVFDFPEKGPNDIYEAGAPRDAKVIIPHSKHNPYITETPDVPALVQALKQYNSARENVISDYILITTYEYDSTIRILDVVYHQGKNQYENQRSICYSARSLVESQSDNEPVKYNFDSLLEWSKMKDNDYQCTAIIHNGRRFFSAEIGLKDPWITEGKRNWPLGINNLLDWGWPEILPKANVRQIENDYSRENGLMAFEQTTEPEVSNGKLMNPAQKDIYYLDPGHDYMCVRKEEYKYFVMGGTPIKDITFDVNEISNEISCIQSVTEFGQTENGQWYPKIIETFSKSWDTDGKEKPLSLSFINTLYLKTKPEFPERFFNPEEPPVPKHTSYSYSSKNPIKRD